MKEKEELKNLLKWGKFSFKGGLYGLIQFLVTESPLKMMKNDAFYFTLKAVFVLKIFKFLASLIGHVEKNDSIGKISLTSKSMTSQSG